MDIEKVLIWAFPDREWSMTNNEYETLLFHDNGPIITLEELEEQNIIYLQYMASTQYQRDRLKEYDNQGCTDHKLIVALWKKVIEGDSTSSDDLQIKREQVQASIPKPS